MENKKNNNQMGDNARNGMNDGMNRAGANAGTMNRNNDSRMGTTGSMNNMNNMNNMNDRNTAGGRNEDRTDTSRRNDTYDRTDNNSGRTGSTANDSMRQTQDKDRTIENRTDDRTQDKGQEWKHRTEQTIDRARHDVGEQTDRMGSRNDDSCNRTK